MPVQLMGYKCALSAKANEGRLVVVDSLVPAAVPVNGVPTIKTKVIMVASCIRFIISR